MTQPDQDKMEVLVVVAMPPVETRVSEQVWEEDIVKAVSAAVHADRTLDAVAVKPLEYENCQWVFEGGMPMPDYDVTVGQDGSWHSGATLFPENPEARGDDLQSLFDYLVEKGRIRK
jgi:hypothetical protein